MVCLSPQGPFEIDHITCVWEGGTNAPENLRALCVECHKKKTALDARARRIRREMSVQKDGPFTAKPVGDRRKRKKIPARETK